MNLKILKRLGIGFLILAATLIVGTSILKFRAEKRAESLTEIRPDGISTLEKVKIGGIDQWVFSRGQSKQNPVLLILHGGPGAGSIGFAREFYGELEKNFVVVNWDQRSAGKSFSFLTPGSSIQPETFISDTHEIILFLKHKFGVSKIYLMGHSWGGYLGAIIAHRYPADLYAYIGIGPVVRGEDSARTSFETVQEGLAKENPEASLTFEDYLKNRRHWLNHFGHGMFHGPHSKDEDNYLGGVMFASPEYSLLDVATYPLGIARSGMNLRKYFFSMDLFEQAPSISVPVYFATGRYDGYNLPEILERYVNVLKSPSKKIFVFENCAHAPHFEEPQNFSARMRTVKEDTFDKNR